MSDPKHPIWSIVRLVIFGLILAPIVYANCNKFDVDEMREIVIFLAVASLGEGVLRWFIARQAS